jgi:bacteriorhodopsin
LSTEELAGLSTSQLLEVESRVKLAFWQFAVVLGLKVVAGMVLWSAYDRATQHVESGYVIANLVLFVALIVSYVFLAVGLTRVSIRLGRNHRSVVAWFIALPVILIALSFVSSFGFELAGFGGFLGFVFVNGLYASPAAIWLSLKRDLEHRLDEATSLRSLAR